MGVALHSPSLSKPALLLLVYTYASLILRLFLLKILSARIFQRLQNFVCLSLDFHLLTSTVYRLPLKCISGIFYHREYRMCSCSPVWLSDIVLVVIRTLSREVISFRFFCDRIFISFWTFSWILGVFINSVVLLLSKTFINSNAPSLLIGYVVLCINSTTGISATIGNLW